MGDRDKAREEVETALAIDPEFLAARLLRDQLNVPAPVAPLPPVAASPPPFATLEASAASLAALEERVRQRVLSRNEAAPATPSGPKAGRTFRYRAGAVAAAAVAFAAAMSSSGTREPQQLASRGTAVAGPLIDLAAPEPIFDAPASATVADDTPEPEPPHVRPAAPSTPPPRAALAPPLSRRFFGLPPSNVDPTPPPSRVAVVSPPPVQPVSPPVTPPPSQPAAAPTAEAATVSRPPSPAPVAADDRVLVEEALSRYRRAYNRLDARSAQAVYPAVNASALARAFDGLESQSLQFDQCDIDMRNGSANVTCRGTSRYVPKIGNRDPRVEPRVWDFILRKDAGDWKIENARAGR